MPSTTHRLETALSDAVEARDDVRACTLRLMLAAVRDREAQSRAEETHTALDSAALRELFGSMVKQRERSIRGYEEAGHTELAEREREEIEVIKGFLPRPLSREQMQKAVQDAIRETQACSIRDLGRVMGHLRAQYPGRIDFCEAGAQVKAALG
ncbi:MAG: GatB/YqeY domain-containing protein, partial [Pseudomonadota bacterium]